MDVPFCIPQIEDEEITRVVATLKSGWLSRGPKCSQFEGAFADYVGAKHAVSLSSCTAALHLALLAHDIGPGDKVIVPSMTFPATVNAVLYVGAEPILIDCMDDYNYHPARLKMSQLDPSVKAIIGVDMHGKPCQTPILPEGVVFIRDAAHSLGALTPDGKVGGLGETTCFSFYATKNITTGDGGMLTTNDPDIAERVKRLSLHGMDVDAWKRYTPNSSGQGYIIPEMGYKYNMTDIQAALGLVQLDRLDDFLRERRYLASRYNLALTDLADEGRLILPPWKGCWHVYAIRVVNRDDVMTKLKARGIGVGIHFRPIHDLPYLQKYIPGLGSEYEYSKACSIGRQTLSLPFYPGMSISEMNYVVENLQEILREQDGQTDTE